MRRALLIAILALAATSGGAAADGGPSPGLASFAGVVGPGGQIRYATVSTDTTTIVEAIRVRDGRILRYQTLKGFYGIPLVAYDGSAGGLSHDARTLVLSTWPVPPQPRIVSRFAVLTAGNLHRRQTIALRGSFAYDALSPDATTLYLIQYSSTSNYDRYRVRAYDVAAGKLLPGAIVDRREPKEPMTGSPVTRVTSQDGRWVYTLYSRSNQKPFIHALDSVDRSAVCIDLDAWRGPQNNLSQLHLALSRDGRYLILRHRNGTRVLAIVTPTR